MLQGDPDISEQVKWGITMGSTASDRQTDFEAGYLSDYSSAGLDTQRFSMPGATPSTAHSRLDQSVLAAPNRRNNIAAFALIGIGALLLVSRLGFVRLNLEAGLILLTIASCFLFFAFWRRIYKLSIPGFILAGLSVGVTFEAVMDGVPVVWGLALGFLMIHTVGGTLFQVRSPWAAIPAVILFGVGCIVAITQLPAMFAAALIWLPLLLVGAGLYLGWGWRPIQP